MATISDSTSAIDGFSSPQSRRVRGGGFSSPWSHVVRGGEAEAIPATSPPPHEKDSNSPEAAAASAVAVAADLGESAAAAAKAKRPAWNKPSNGVVEIGGLMDGSWPALSESARSSPKSSSDSLKALADGSASASAPASAPAPQGIVVPSSSQKLILNSSNTNSNSSTTPKKSGKRGGTSNNVGVQSVPSVETIHNNSDKPAMVGMDSSPRDSSQKNNNWEAASRGNFNLQQPHVAVDQPRSSYRRGSGGGPHPRGSSDGGYHGNYGSRRDQDRQNYEWNTHQSFSGRDIHIRQQRTAPRSFTRQPPPTPPPFISPLPMQPYASPIGFPDLRSQLYYVPAPPPESLSGVIPFVAHAAPPGMFISTPDPQLRSMLVKQIDYYFSPENLCKDIFLRQNMDERGWVPISLIASFNRVKQLTIYIPFILDAVRTSTVVEVQGDKIRKWNDWKNWLLPPQNLLGGAVTGPLSPNYESLATQMQSIGLEGTTNHNSQRALVDSHTEGILTRSLSSEPSSRLQGSMPAEHAEIVHTSNQMGSDRSISLRSLEKSVSC